MRSRFVRPDQIGIEDLLIADDGDRETGKSASRAMIAIRPDAPDAASARSRFSDNGRIGRQPFPPER